MLFRNCIITRQEEDISFSFFHFSDEHKFYELCKYQSQHEKASLLNKGSHGSGYIPTFGCNYLKPPKPQILQ